LFDEPLGLFDTPHGTVPVEFWPSLSDVWLWFKYLERASIWLAVFDKVPSGKETRSTESEAPRRDPEEARIALRCTLKELRLIDSFVASGEFGTRSELMRAALHAFLRSRTMSSTTTPPVDADGFVEVPIRLKPEECAAADAYARQVGNRMELRDALALIFRHGEHALKVDELVKRAREQTRDAAENREQVDALSESGRDLARRGFVGR
jgi:Arc/MetJ-type ribon-helix-helix transcriptional regulator